MFWLTFQGSCNVRSFPKNYPNVRFAGAGQTFETLNLLLFL